MAGSGMKKSTAAAINATPPDNASMLSSMLKAFVIPTIQTAVATHQMMEEPAHVQRTKARATATW